MLRYIQHDALSSARHTQFDDLKKAQVAVAIEGAHRSNTHHRVDDEQEKHHHGIEIITGLKKAIILSLVVSSDHSDKN